MIRTRRRIEVHAATHLGLAALAGFIVLTILVELRLLEGIDVAVAASMKDFGGPLLDWVSVAAGNMMAAEASVLYGVLAAFILWRAGTGLPSLAPLAFLIPTALEVLLKAVIDQPHVPSELLYHNVGGYAFANIPSEGTFPSGHALRSVFFFTFLAVLVRHQMWSFAPALAGLLLALGPALALTRVYVGWHWLSDVAGGVLLGFAFAILAATPLARRIGRTH